MLASISSLFATKIVWTWHSSDENVKYFRYKLLSQDEAQDLSQDQNSWTIVDSSTTSVKLKTQNNSTLYVQASYDGINWSESSFETYQEEEKKSQISLRANLAPYSSAVYYFYNGHYIDEARTLMVSGN